MQDACNEVLDKPAFQELTEFCFEADDVVQQADAAWEQHLSCYRSVVGDTLGGQLQSTTTCGNCEWKSLKFDPCFGLELAIPSPGEGQEAVSLEVSQQLSRLSVRPLELAFVDLKSTTHVRHEEFNG